MSFMWRYFFATFTMFIVAPELRRIQDMFIGYSPLEIWSILPLLMLIPFFYVVGMNGRYRRLPPLFQKLAWLWIGGFTYALFLSVLQNNVAAGALTFAQFVFPLGAGLWVATEDLPAVTVYRRVTNYLFVTMTFVCAYGIIQWVVIPPWDALWLSNIHATSFGTAAPFKLRAFSTLNAPGLLGNFAALTVILGLPRVSTKDWKFTAAFGIWILGMGVTTVRTSWVMFALGAIIYFVLTKRVQQLIAIVALGTVFTLGLGAIDPENPVLSTVGDRVSSFGDIQSDESFNQRSSLYSDMIPDVLQGPIGMGLGVFGAGGKMSSEGMQIDSGILSRLLEMGWAGCGMLASALLMALTFCIRGFFGEAIGTSIKAEIFATLIAMQVALLFLEISGEAHFGILGLLFWTTAAAMAIPIRKPLQTMRYSEQVGHTVTSGSI